MNLAHRRLRAPDADGFALIDPPLSQAAALIERNRAIGAAFDRSSGLSSDLRQQARRSMLRAIAWDEERDPEAINTDLPLIMSGHQPELFHPGVWLKNFVIDSVARASAGTAINLVVDDDVIRQTSIRVPTIDEQGVRIAEIPFDVPGQTIPWQVRDVLNCDIFRSFGSQVREAFASAQSSSAYKRGMLIDQLWIHAIASFERERELSHESIRTAGRGIIPENDLPAILELLGNSLLARCLTQARHALERELGLRTSEFPLSLSRFDEPYTTFAGHLLTSHRELHEIYNAALADYRVINGVRSRSRPVPDLTRDGEWFEAPFWIWNDRNLRRRRVFVRQTGQSWELTDREGLVVAPAKSGTLVSEDLCAVRAHLSPRALITTMYARLVLSDLFIHGIGGAKYDEVTDLIIRRFFGIEPPAYITATATFRLPIERPQVTLQDVREAAQRIREARYRPESFVRDPLVANEPAISAPLAALAAEKRAYLDRHDLRRCEPHVFAHLDRLNRAMHERLAPVERELRARHADLVTQAQQSQLLGSREFSFVLFPSEILPARLLDLCKVSP